MQVHNFGCCLFSTGEQEASFTKDDMQQGKHQEYERKLHEQLQNQSRDT
jgi:CCR4-NOT transcription complex subunit 4